ncbi:MAG: ABC transporter ATP-binding protein [Anaerolinea sp.]|nr:ABC transporter ATP-binding protein [Anaerolinea sp.]
MNNSVIETKGLTVYYGKHRGVVDLNLTVRQGEVFGFLGPNGAGKTTTQRVLLDIIRPSQGTAHIFGQDCQRDGVAIRKRVGYIPGELALPFMKASAYLDMLVAVRGNHTDPAYRRMLCERLNLDTSRKMREYSRGNKQKVGVVAAFMSKPDLLILDEPTSGLDPLMQQTVLELVREAQADGRTVFFSSHILSEVQAVCDRVGIIRNGQLVAVEKVQDLLARRLHRLRLQFRALIAPELLHVPGITVIEHNADQVMVEVQENLDEFMAQVAPYGIIDIETVELSLEEVFLAYYGGGNGHV